MDNFLMELRGWIFFLISLIIIILMLLGPTYLIPFMMLFLVTGHAPSLISCLMVGAILWSGFYLYQRRKDGV